MHGSAFRCGAAALCAFAFAAGTARAQAAFRVGDGVEAYSPAWGGATGWGAASVVAVDTSGQHLGPYQVRFDAQGATQWVAADQIRARAPAAGAAAGAGAAPPAGPGGFSVGEGVEAYSPAYGGPTGWAGARVVAIDDSGQHIGPFQVRFANGAMQWVAADQIRAAAAAGPAQGAAPRQPAQAADFAVGARVDDVSDTPPGQPVRGASLLHRGTVVAVNGHTLSVRYDGCSTTTDRDVSRLRAAAQTSAGDPDVRFTFGAWNMYTPGNWEGANAPPLRINPDGSYVWRFSFDRPAVSGRWTLDARVDGANMGADLRNGVVIKDLMGAPWKVYRAERYDGRQGVVVRKQCEGVEMTGTR